MRDDVNTYRPYESPEPHEPPSLEKPDRKQLMCIGVEACFEWIDMMAEYRDRVLMRIAKACVWPIKLPFILLGWLKFKADRRALDGILGDTNTAVDEPVDEVAEDVDRLYAAMGAIGCAWQWHKLSKIVALAQEKYGFTGGLDYARQCFVTDPGYNGPGRFIPKWAMCDRGGDLMVKRLKYPMPGTETTYLDEEFPDAEP